MARAMDNQVKFHEIKPFMPLITVHIHLLGLPLQGGRYVHEPFCPLRVHTVKKQAIEQAGLREIMAFNQNAMSFKERRKKK